jgi:mannose-6-phosphate isomerase
METTERPWGTYTVIYTASNHQVKTLTVNPGQRLSYQTHEHRAEYWVIVEGHGTVTLNGVDSEVTFGDALIVEIGDAHRIANTGDAPLTFIEVQIGAILTESDIVRLEDDYNRE